MIDVTAPWPLIACHLDDAASRADHLADPRGTSADWSSPQSMPPALVTSRGPVGDRHPFDPCVRSARFSTRPDRTGRPDRLILSKGHCAAALYSVLAMRGFIDPRC